MITVCLGRGTYMLLYAAVHAHRHLTCRRAIQAHFACQQRWVHLITKHPQ